MTHTATNPSKITIVTVSKRLYLTNDHLHEEIVHKPYNINDYVYHI